MSGGVSGYKNGQASTFASIRRRIYRARQAQHGRLSASRFATGRRRSVALRSQLNLLSRFGRLEGVDRCPLRELPSRRRDGFLCCDSALLSHVLYSTTIIAS